MAAEVFAMCRFKLVPTGHNDLKVPTFLDAGIFSSSPGSIQTRFDETYMIVHSECSSNDTPWELRAKVLKWCRANEGLRWLWPYLKGEM